MNIELSTDQLITHDCALEKGTSQSTMVTSENEDSSSKIKSSRKGWANSSVKQTIGVARSNSKPDNIYRKPGHSYSSLISQAVRTCPKGQMTLNEIYIWLVEKFPYFRAAGAGWKNSIRHTLSTNPKFIRVPRPAKEPGKGAYWTIRDFEKQDSNISLGAYDHAPAYFPPKQETDDVNFQKPQFYESNPEIVYANSYDNSRYMSDNHMMFEHYPQIYLPTFASDRTSPRLTHAPSADGFYGYESNIQTAAFHPESMEMASFSTLTQNRNILSKESSFFDDWSATNTSSMIKLDPLSFNYNTEDIHDEA